VDDAITFGEAEPISNLDEINPLRILYFKALFIARAWDQDAEADASLNARIEALTQQEREGRTKGITHYTTFCTEVREVQMGDAELAKGDAEAAQTHYETALAANPHHVNALLGMAAARYHLGDIDGAIAKATAATELNAPQPDSWADVGRYHLATGDSVAAGTAYGRFLDLVSDEPPQARMALVGDAIDQLHAFLKDHPERASLVAGVVPDFRAALDSMVTDASDTYQLPALAVSLGTLALSADDAAAAEPLFRQALELDPLQPDAHANLIVSVLVQDRDATADIDAAFAALDDPEWAQIPGYEDPDVLLDIMEDEAAAYVDRFPDRQATIEPFTSLLPAERERQSLRLQGVAGTTYTSANFDYAVAWDDTWTVNEASTDVTTGADLLQLDNGVSTVQFSASNMEAADASACLDTTIQQLTTIGLWDSSITTIDPEDEAVAGEPGNRAYAVFVEQDDALVYYVACRPLDAPGAFASVVAIVPVIVYEQQAAAVDQVLVSFAAPASVPDATADPTALPMIDLSAVVADVPDVTENAYTSPTYGYRLGITPPWVPVTSSSEGGLDSLQLTDGRDDLFIDWFAGDASDPNSCVGDVARELDGNESLVNVSGFNGPDGEPMRGNDGDMAFAVFSFQTLDGAASSPDSVLYVECRVLAGDTMLRVLHLSTPEQLERNAPARDTLISGMTRIEPAMPAPGRTPV
jgi:tetratricopeptide (TPR) repeat protein